jgi:hypothetical protein
MCNAWSFFCSLLLAGIVYIDIVGPLYMQTLLYDTHTTTMPRQPALTCLPTSVVSSSSTKGLSLGHAAPACRKGCPQWYADDR